MRIVMKIIMRKIENWIEYILRTNGFTKYCFRKSTRRREQEQKERLKLLVDIESGFCMQRQRYKSDMEQNVSVIWWDLSHIRMMVTMMMMMTTRMMIMMHVQSNFLLMFKTSDLLVFLLGNLYCKYQCLLPYIQKKLFP